MFGYKRFKKRVKVDFTDGLKSGRGFTHEIAEDYIIMTCRKPLPRGSWVELTVTQPDGRTGRVKAKVVVSSKPVSTVTEGHMELEVTLYNRTYSNFLRSIVGELKGNDLSLLIKPGDFPGDVEENAPAKEAPVAPPAEEFVPEPEPEPVPETASEPEPAKEEEFILMECEFCGTKNKIPEDKLFDKPICAMCKEPLMKTS